MSALFHYITHGHTEGRAPHPLFDADLVRAQTRNENDPLAAYLAAMPGSVRPHADFDEAFVLKQIGSELRTGETALAAYLRLSHTINPSAEFDCTEYLLSYPDIKDLHPFYHYIRWGKAEGRSIGAISKALRGVVDEIEFAATRDPDIVPPYTDINFLPKVVRLSNKSIKAELMAALLSAVSPNRQTVLYLVNDFVAGGAERVLANLVSAHQRDVAIEQVVVLATGGVADAAQAWLPHSDLVVVNVAKQVAGIDNIREAASVMATFLQLLAVRAVCVINSELGWSMIEMHGEALRAKTRLMACAFCYDYDSYGRRAGYAWTELANSFRHLDLLITDNTSFAFELKGDFRLSDDDFSRIKVLYQPARDAAAAAQPRSQVIGSGRPSVLWAGRFSRQKRVGLALSIASRMPGIQFLFAGGEAQDIERLPGPPPPNVKFLGRFTDFAALPYRRCSAFLYTSAWDGLPNVLLEAASVGLPIVAPEIGGIPELIHQDTGWLVADHWEPDAYVSQLRAALEQTDTAHRRTRGLRDLIDERHDPQTFTETVRSMFADCSRPARRR
ncbi:hypothetical protein HPGCJGGD_3160 [Methylobacterium haplocladii]|nr:hypothetical protein HPGCJGGD_3160 [Methylobacterium haplocladii]